jgi:hypothetical protein
MGAAVIQLKCARCKAKFEKKLAEYTYQLRKAGVLDKPFFCSRACGQAYSGETFQAFTDIRAIAKSLRNREWP